uniref:(northern house mosquito) hypothetical protein n=1 Tax=Culex pipiens TaxID=7175 RepID=A0A8D8BZA3_CULPI
MFIQLMKIHDFQQTNLPQQPFSFLFLKLKLYRAIICFFCLIMFSLFFSHHIFLLVMIYVMFLILKSTCFCCPSFARSYHLLTFFLRLFGTASKQPASCDFSGLVFFFLRGVNFDSFALLSRLCCLF